MTVEIATPQTGPVVDVPAAGAAWAVAEVAGELREAYLAVAAAGALLERTGAGCTHPAIRQARRCGEDALDLAGDAEQMLSDGVRRLHANAGHEQPTSIAALVEVLDASRGQLSDAADRIRQFPARITAAGQQLLDAGQPDPTTEAVTDQWNRAAEELALMAASLGAAVGALSSYTSGLSGAGTATT